MLLYVFLFGVLPVVVTLVAAIPLYSATHGRVIDADSGRGLPGVYVFGFDDHSDSTIDKTRSFLSAAITDKNGEFDLPSHWDVMWKVHDPKETFWQGMVGWLAIFAPLGHAPSVGNATPRFVLRAYSADHVAPADEQAVDALNLADPVPAKPLSKNHSLPILLKGRALSVREAAIYYSSMMNDLNQHLPANPARKVAFEEITARVCSLPFTTEIDALTFSHLTQLAVAKDPFDLNVAVEQAYMAMAKLEPENIFRTKDDVYRAGNVCTALSAAASRPDPPRSLFVY